MAKVGSLGGGRQYKKTLSEKSNVRKEKPTGKVFTNILETEMLPPNPIEGIYSTDGNTTLEDLLDAVHERGENLIKKTNVKTIEAYKFAVKRFLNYVVAESLKVESVDGLKFNRFKPANKQKRYTLISVVDDKLNKLAAGILLNQEKQMDLLAKVEEINGLLVDLIS